jgi:hypothetical protein
MTRLTTSPRQNAVDVSSSRVAGVSSHGGGLTMVVVERADAGSTKLLHARQYTPADAATLSADVQRFKAQLVVRVAPAERTVSRCVALPEDLARGDAAALASAMSLLAEAELPASIPAHRRAAGLLDLTGSGRAGVLLSGWVNAPDDGAIRPLTSSAGRRSSQAAVPECWCAETAALASLATMLRGALPVDSNDGVLVAHMEEAGSGTLSMLASGLTGSIVRHLRLGSARVSRSQAIADALAETAHSVGITGLDTSRDTRGIIVVGLPSPAELLGQPRDQQWLDAFGMACGAAAIGLARESGQRSHASMLAEPVVEETHAFLRLVDWFAPRQRLVGTLAACAMLVLLTPLGVAAARSSILSSRAGGAADLNQRLDEAKRRDAFAKLLRQKRWPMSKLMAEVVRAAPVGVSLDALEIVQGDSITVRGTATNPEHLTTFRRSLVESGVFTQVATPSLDSQGDAVEFQLQARVASALTSASRLEDFAKVPLAVRLYGERAAASGTTRPSDSTATSATSTTPPENDRSSASSGPANRPDRTRSSTRPSSEPPAPLTDEQIAKMDRATAMKEWTSRKAAATKETDAAIKQRLMEESEKCRARMQEASGSSRAAPVIDDRGATA